MVSTFEAIVDCNGNGVADDSDIANGTSDDMNSNDIPDECESCVLPELEVCSSEGVEYPGPIVGDLGTGVACPSGVDTYLNPYETSEIATGDLLMSCVEVAVANLTTESIRYTVSVLAEDLSPLSEVVEFCQAENTLSTVKVAFESPVSVPEGSFWIALTRDAPTAGFASFGTSDAPVGTETYLLSPNCGATAPVSIDDLAPPGQDFSDIDMAVVMTFVDDDEPACPEDVDENGSVDFNDILAVLSAWGTDDAAADVDESGSVDFNDVLALLSAWGSC